LVAPFPEWGYISLNEMAGVTVPAELVVIERSGQRRYEYQMPAFEADPSWNPVALHEAIAEWEGA